MTMYAPQDSVFVTRQITAARPGARLTRVWHSAILSPRAAERMVAAQAQALAAEGFTVSAAPRAVTAERAGAYPGGAVTERITVSPLPASGAHRDGWVM